jgi:hypothetical protein
MIINYAYNLQTVFLPSTYRLALPARGIASLQTTYKNWCNRFTDIAAAIAYGHCIFLAAICLFFLCRRELEMRSILCQRFHLLRGSGVLSAGPERSAAGVCRKCGDGALWPGHQGNVRCPCRPKLGQKLSVCSQRVRKSDRVHSIQGLV